MAERPRVDMSNADQDSGSHRRDARAGTIALMVRATRAIIWLILPRATMMLCVEGSWAVRTLSQDFIPKREDKA